MTLPPGMAQIIRESLMGHIDKGLAGVAEGHTEWFDAARIIEQRRKL